MTSLQSMHGKDLIILLKKAGFRIVGERGGHVSLRKGNARLIIPSGEMLGEKTLQNLIEQANLTSKEIAALLSGGEIEESIPESFDEPAINEPAQDIQERAVLPEQGFFAYAWRVQARTFPLGLIRIVIGALFIITALETAPWLGPNFGWYADFLRNLVQYPTFEFCKTFIVMVVQPSLPLFGWLHFLLNLGIGVSLLLGFFGRLASAIGFFWTAHLMVLRLYNPGWWVWTDIMMVSLLFLFWTMKASRCLGIDQKLAPYFESRSDNWFFRVFAALV
ncbi:type II toxin-antitoxin system HicA family toxin [Candidatus Woesearchaeota archaeon]|nr:type II toxin-antitoxin system HicA family toxin [Candidatus Woesearchaeota archaeon]